MRMIKTIAIIFLLILPNILLAQKDFTITGEIDPKMNGQTIKMYWVLPSYSIFLGKVIPSEAIVKDGRFSFKAALKGYETFGFQITHHGESYNQTINMLPQDLKIIFLDTLLKTYRVHNDQGFNDTCNRAFSKQWEARKDTALSIKIAEEYIKMPFASCILFWLVKDIPEQEILRLYKMIPAIHKQNSWSIDLELLIAKFLIGKPAMNFTQQNPEGKNISLSDYKGKYVLLDFWASWCIPCRKDNPNLVKAYADFKDKGFDILSVSLDNEKAEWVEAIKTDRLNWQHVSDLKGWKNEVSKGIYNVSSVPQNYLIDPNGIIIQKNLTGGKLLEFLKETLK